MKRIKLIAVDSTGTPVKSHNCGSAVKFVDANDYFSITKVNDKLRVITPQLQIITPKDTYYLTKHASLDIYQGILKGHKVHVSLKKIVGELRYW